MNENRKTIVLWCLAILCGIGTVYALYRIEASYCRALYMNWTGWLGGFIGGCIAAWLSADRPPQKKLSRKQKIFCYLILAAIVALLFRAAPDGSKMRIFPFQMLALLLPVLWEDMRMEKGADRRQVFAQGFILTAALLTAVSFGAPKALGYVTTAEAGRGLAAQGYTNVAFAQSIRGEWLLHEAADKTFYHEELRSRTLYLFFVEQAGEDWVIAVNPMGGESILSAPAADEPALAD